MLKAEELRLRRAALLGSFVFLSVYISLVSQIEHRSDRIFHENLDKHIQVIRNALWILDPSTPLEYLPVVMRHEHILSVRILENDGSPFLELDLPEESRIFKALIHRGLIGVESDESELIYNGQLIGTVSFKYYNRNILVYLNIFAFLVLLYFLYFSSLRKSIRNREVRLKSLELAKTVKELRSTQQQLVASEKQAAMGRLISGLAHEINTPIGTVYTYLTFLAEQSSQFAAEASRGDLDRKRLMEFLGTLEDSLESSVGCIDRTNTLVRSFKDAAASDDGIKRNSFDLNEVLKYQIASLRKDSDRPELELDFVSEGALMMTSYPFEIIRIVSELTTNARVHGFAPNESGRICLETSGKSDDLIMISFSDTGAGMTEAVREHLFDPFFTTRRGDKYIGLGMHLVHNIVTQILKGSIRVDSTPGSGTRYEIILPVIV